MKPAVRFILGFLFVVFCLLAIKVPSFAQTTTTPPPNQAVNNYVSPNTDSNVPTNLHTWTQNVMIEVMSAMTCQLAGIDPTNPNAKCLGVDQKTGKIGFVENGGGAIGVMGGMISMLYTPPAHTSDYIKYLSGNFGIAKPAYAANCDPTVSGIGFCGIFPLINIWTKFRDIVYLIFVLVFIVIGLAIMLRVKIDPRTVMTVQNQIPKIIIGILLVTFSFAIAGFLIDIMWVTIYLFINVMVGVDPKITASAAQGITNQMYGPAPGFANYTLSGGSVLGGIHNVAWNAAGSIQNIIFNLIDPQNLPAPTTGVGGNGCSFGPFCIVTNVIGGTVLGLVSALMGGVISFIVGMIAFLIIIIAIIWSLFRLWFALISAYVFILVDIIFAPFWIVSGLLPGGQTLGFNAWLRDMLGNLAAFPVTIVMFLLARVLMDSFSTIGTNAFVPPLIGTPGSTDSLGALIALGFIFTTPHVVNITKAAFKAPKIDLGPIGQAVNVGAGFTSVPGQAARLGYNLQYMRQVPVLGGWLGRVGLGGAKGEARTPKVTFNDS